MKKRPKQSISRKDRSGFYITGFVDGEGSFNVSLRKKEDYQIGWQVVLCFNVSQKDITLLNILKEVLGCGIIKTRKIDGLFMFEVTSIGDINRKVIPFFDKYNFISENKKRNFAIFCKIAKLVGEGKHRRKKSLKEILLLRETLNLGKGRKRKYSFSDVFK